jgi:hypothetical protein
LHFLQCIKNEVSGGESILVDGFRVAEDFRQDHPQYFQTLVEIPAQFEKFYSESRWYNRRTQSIFELDSRGEIIGICFNNSHAWTWDIPFDEMEYYYQAYCEWFRYPHGVTSSLKSKSRAVFPCCPTLNNCQQPEGLLRMNDNDNHYSWGGRGGICHLSPPRVG